MPSMRDDVDEPSDGDNAAGIYSASLTSAVTTVTSSILPPLYLNPSLAAARSNGLTTSSRAINSLAYATRTSANNRAFSRRRSDGKRKELAGELSVRST